MAHIKLKDGKQIKVDRPTGRKIRAAFEDSSIKGDVVISLDDQSFTKSLIAYVSINDEEDAATSEKDRNLTHAQQLKKEQLDEFEALLALDPEERAKNTAYFEFFFAAMTDRKPTETEKRSAVILSKEFFEKDNVPYPAPGIFVPMILDGNPPQEIGGYQKVLVDVASNIYLIASRYVPRDEYINRKLWVEQDA